ncbi:MAG: SIR2 family protein [Oligoflexia bacterium]|nr:SIR2 family protein [Oligoflexia bacterium]
MSNNKEKTNYLKVSSDPEYVKLIWNDEKFKTTNSHEDSDKTTKTHLDLRKKIEPWLTALFQSERLNLLIGSGLTISQAKIASDKKINFMETVKFDIFSKQIEEASKKLAEQNGRKSPNIEDNLNVVNALLAGLKVYTENNNTELKNKIKKLEDNKNTVLKSFINQVLSVEKELLNKQKSVEEYLIPFLMSFASRTLSRERLHIFTTNYDRVIEWGADLTGLRLIDRFVGHIEPIFRASRLNIDMHYNPPGIRGEPRYLEGVAYFTKLHGSLDWHYKNNRIQRVAMPFGETKNIPSSNEHCLIYPNSAKEWQTTNYPYSELFRDFATSICRPNTTLVTYGYGFADEHINRIIEDMLTIPSTHLVIISYDCTPKINLYICKEQSSKKEQISILVGPQLADIKNLVKYYLPKSAIDQSMKRMLEIQKQRGQLNTEQKDSSEESEK